MNVNITEIAHIFIYTANSGLTKIDVKIEDETLWFTQIQMCELYQTSIANVVEHIKYIYGGDDGSNLSEFPTGSRSGWLKI